ncbi:MAG: VOC family protein [Pseudomonadota bacterium]
MLRVACPLMPSRDLAETARFYAGLGFEAVNRYAEERYLIVAREGVELHFFDAEGRAPDQSGSGAYLRTGDAAGWSAAVAALGLPGTGVPRFSAVEDKPWGMREFSVVDPDGNLLRVGQDMDKPHG